MEKLFEPVLSRNNGMGEVRFTATPELVRRETKIDRPTVADIKRWLEDNADAAAHAASIWRLSHHVHAVGPDGTREWDGVVRLGLTDFPAI